MDDKAFKEALQKIAPKEKDKLILRLLKKDQLLTERLYFELVDSDSTLERRENLEKKINITFENIIKNKFYVKAVLITSNELIRDITRHKQVTKDKYGEVYLNTYLVNALLNLVMVYDLAYSKYEMELMYIFIIEKAFKTLVILKKLHPDYAIEFKNDFTLMGTLLTKSNILKQYCQTIGFQITWLIDYEIPENIEELYKARRRI